MMKYCSSCGADIKQEIPSGDNRLRHVCGDCGTIFYENPKIVAGCIPTWQGKILLCRRAIEPRYGLWTLPGGFMENDETTHEGALRETLEEAGARVTLHGLYTFYSLPHINQVHLFFRATLQDLDFAAGAESLEVALFRKEEIPWQQIAFPAVGNTLEHYYRDLPGNTFPVRSADVILTANRERIIRPHQADTP